MQSLHCAAFFEMKICESLPKLMSIYVKFILYFITPTTINICTNQIIFYTSIVFFLKNTRIESVFENNRKIFQYFHKFYQGMGLAMKW